MLRQLPTDIKPIGLHMGKKWAYMSAKYLLFKGFLPYVKVAKNR